jgi:hypothetical protein
VESGDDKAQIAVGQTAQKSDDRHRRLLRVCEKWPECRRNRERTNKRPPFHVAAHLARHCNGEGTGSVNDAERLRHDPAMRWIVGGKAAHGRAASPSQMGRDLAIAADIGQAHSASTAVDLRKQAPRLPSPDYRTP